MPDPTVIHACMNVNIQALIDAERAAREALGRLVSMYASGDISEDEWQQGRKRANDRLETARKRLERGRQSLDAPTADDYAALAGVTEEVWRALSPDDQHSVLRLLIEYVEVNPRGCPPRVRVHWRKR